MRPPFTAVLNLGSEHHLVSGHEWYVPPFLSHLKPPVVYSQARACMAVPEVLHTYRLDDASRLARAAKLIDHAFKTVHLAVD